MLAKRYQLSVKRLGKIFCAFTKANIIFRLLFKLFLQLLKRKKIVSCISVKQHLLPSRLRTWYSPASATAMKSYVNDGLKKAGLLLMGGTLFPITGPFSINSAYCEFKVVVELSGLGHCTTSK